MKSKFTILLFDNGSLRPQACLALRALAKGLSEITGLRVEPVSLLHSHKINAAELEGEPATIIRRRFKAGIANGEEHFICLPLFLGPSLAITDYLQELIEEARALAPSMEIRVAPPLAGWDVSAPDPRLAEILADQVRSTMDAEQLSAPINLALVDHGSPIEVLSILRNRVAEQLQKLLGEKVQQVYACSMERRAGDAYAFNDPLLETLNFSDEYASGSDALLLVALFFLLPGRHAGSGGDVEAILDKMVEAGNINAYFKTDLIGSHPLLYSILSDRLASVA